MFNRLWTQAKWMLLEDSDIRKGGKFYSLLRNICWLAADEEKKLEEDAKLGWFDKEAK